MHRHSSLLLRRPRICLHSRPGGTWQAFAGLQPLRHCPSTHFLREGQALNMRTAPWPRWACHRTGGALRVGLRIQGRALHTHH